ncbi:MAG: argininosuccinate lyase, partial [Methanobacteriota archaeon]
RANVSPLGAGALAGSTLPIDPATTARTLGFAAAFENSIDAVSDRDYYAEFLFDLALLAVHLSSLGEELVLWASTEFGFVHPAPELGSGSSLMPQKRNPDVAELARGKTGRVVGDLVSLLTTLKALPLAYNRDVQEDKAPVFDAVDQVLPVLDALAAAMSSLAVDEVRLAEAASDPRILATDLAEYLVSRGVPFREAHETVARYLTESTGEVEATSLQAFDPRFGDDVAGVLDARTSLARRKTHGGPSPEAVKAQLARAHETIGQERYFLSKHVEPADVVDRLLKGEPE